MFISIIFYVLCITIIVNIIMINLSKTSERTKLINKFCLGLLLMVVSFLGGFTIGAFIIPFAIVVWVNILIKNFNNIKIKLVTFILLAITIVEAWLLKPG